MLIVILLMSIKSFGQSDSLIFTTVSSDQGVSNYQIETSADSSKWTSIFTILPFKLKSNGRYSYPLSISNIYYRIFSQMISGTYATNAMYYVHGGIKDTVTITNLKVKWGSFFDNLSWTTTNETNVNYYLIEYLNRNTWTQVSQVDAKGNSNYATQRRNWFGAKTKYRVTAFFVDGKKNTPVNFN